MKKNYNKLFEKLLSKRRKLASLNKNIKVKANDSQLKDTIDNFNESNLYKKK